MTYIIEKFEQIISALFCLGKGNWTIKKIEFNRVNKCREPNLISGRALKPTFVSAGRELGCMPVGL